MAISMVRASTRETPACPSRLWSVAADANDERVRVPGLEPVDRRPPLITNNPVADAEYSPTLTPHHQPKVVRFGALAAPGVAAGPGAAAGAAFSVKAAQGAAVPSHGRQSILINSGSLWRPLAGNSRTSSR